MITIFFSLLLFYNNAFSQYITKFDQWIFNFKQHRTLSILIGNDKEIFFQKTLPKQLQKPIRIFSLSKIIINLYIADLVNKNIITLDTPLSEIFTPYPEHWSKEITIKNLLEMNSGLRAPTVSDPNFGNGIIIGRYDKKYSSFLNQNLINSIQAFKPGFDFHYSIIDHLLLVEVINALNNSTNLNQKLKHFSSKLNLMNTRISYRSNEYGQYPFLKNILPNFSLGIQILKDDFIVWSSVEDLYSLAQLFLKIIRVRKHFYHLVGQNILGHLPSQGKK
jgi:hypothetical protein